MTRKHFQAIADAIAEEREKAAIEYEFRDGTSWAEGQLNGIDAVAKRLSYAVGQFNDHFDREKFLRACGVDK